MRRRWTESGGYGGIGPATWMSQFRLRRFHCRNCSERDIDETAASLSSMIVPQETGSVCTNEGILMRYTTSTGIPVDETSEVGIEARISHRLGLSVFSSVNWMRQQTFIACKWSLISFLLSLSLECVTQHYYWAAISRFILIIFGDNLSLEVIR